MSKAAILVWSLLMCSCAAGPAVHTSRGLATISARTLGSGPTRIYLIACIHGDEREGLNALADISRALPFTGTSVRLVENMNPDGAAAGTRGNRRGVDLNRNWPASNFAPSRATGPRPLSEPETAAVHDDILRFDPHLIVVLHSARNGPFINFDGPPAARTLADRFAAAAKAAGDPRWRVVPDMGYPTPGSMGSYFGKDRGLVILTVECRRAEPLPPGAGPLVAALQAVARSRDVALNPLSTARPVRLASKADRASGTSDPAR